ncbi:MAG: radical SAM protein [Treponema sp.]|jgi:histidinol dehydrogenase|nr:radical SAM protein [Treponema sp.]
MKEFSAGPVENHRGREGGAIVYPVYSRRSRGLSVGINLFPDRKVCSFDCPYCEVFPFQTDIRFSLPVMEEALRDVLADAADRGIPVRDVCFSGNGEPSISPDFRQALEAAGRIRDIAIPEAVLVVITNGTGLLNDETFAFMREAASGPMKLNIWLKLDAGSPDWYKAMDRSAVPFDALIRGIRQFAGLAPVTLQTMVCAVGGRPPPPEEEAAWVCLAAELAESGGGPGRRPGIRAVQIYGKARPAPQDPLAEALPEAVLEKRAAALRTVIGTAIPVEVFP